MGFLQGKFANVIEKGAEAALPIIGGIAGGPAGAAAGQAAAKGLQKAVHNPHDKSNQGPASFTPSSAASLPEARAQDRVRMKDQYGLGNNGG
jgi:hypothetical protein